MIKSLNNTCPCGVTASTQPCHGCNPSSILGMGVKSIANQWIILFSLPRIERGNRCSIWIKGLLVNYNNNKESTFMNRHGRKCLESKMRGINASLLSCWRLKLVIYLEFDSLQKLLWFLKATRIYRINSCGRHGRVLRIRSN